MLSRKEKSVMLYLYDMCQKKGTALLSALDIADGVFPKYDLSEQEVSVIINNLVLENYITVINSDKKGKAMFCVNLSTKGDSFMRELNNSKKTINLLILRTVLLGCLSFLVGMILKTIFS